MTSFNPFSLPILFFSILSLSFLSLTTHAADPVYLTDVCANNTFSANSIYQSNLKSLLSSLDSNATRNIEFFNTTTGQNTSDPVYGLFNCCGDVTPQLCRDCVNAAVKVLTSKCSREKVALTYYDECIVRYSNRSFFSTVDEKPRLGLLNTQNVTDQDKFNRLLNTSMLELATETSDAPTGSKKFKTKRAYLLFKHCTTLHSVHRTCPAPIAKLVYRMLWSFFHGVVVENKGVELYFLVAILGTNCTLFTLWQPLRLHLHLGFNLHRLQVQVPWVDQKVKWFTH